MALMDVFTHFSIIRRERRGIDDDVEVARDVGSARAAARRAACRTARIRHVCGADHARRHDPRRAR